MISLRGAAVACIALGIAVAIALSARAQDSSANHPARNLQIDLLKDSPNRKVIFENGATILEVAIQMMIAGRVRLDFVKPADGSLELQLVNENGIELTQPDPKTGQGAELISAIEIVGPADVAQAVEAEVARLLAPGIQRAQKEATKKPRAALEEYLKKRSIPIPGPEDALLREYALAWAKENTAQPVLEQIRPLVEKHPKWFSRDELASLQAARGIEGCDQFIRLMTDDLYDEQLQKCGLGLTTEGGATRKRLAPRFNAVYNAMTGTTPNLRRPDKKGQENRLQPADEKKLRQVLTADFKCRFTFSDDPADPNSHCGNAQRVACGRGGPAMRIEGRLEPGAPDLADWWRLDRWKKEETILELSPFAAARFEQYPIEGGLLLRVVATGAEPVDYHFEIHSASKPKTKAAVVLHEVPSAGIAKFPF